LLLTINLQVNCQLWGSDGAPQNKLGISICKQMIKFSCGLRAIGNTNPSRCLAAGFDHFENQALI
jgi:hypothetical protein